MTTPQRSGDDGLTGPLADAFSGRGVTAQGLSQTEANRRVRRYGPNLLEGRALRCLARIYRPGQVGEPRASPAARSVTVKIVIGDQQRATRHLFRKLVIGIAVEAIKRWFFRHLEAQG